MNIFLITIVTLIYLIITAYLGYLGFKHTRDTTDYLLAGRKMHPVIMAISYGSTFISTSAIVGFGGAAAVFGMGVLWLTFLNIFVGIFIAFAIFGKRTRKMGHNLDAHTFPELIGKRFNSRFLQAAAGILIFIAMRCTQDRSSSAGPSSFHRRCPFHTRRPFSSLSRL
jgi:SSS family solute:Na+ symporter